MTWIAAWFPSMLLLVFCGLDLGSGPRWMCETKQCEHINDLADQPVHSPFQ